MSLKKEIKNSRLPIWVMQNGDSILIANMHNFHLINAINMVRRNNSRGDTELVPGYSDLVNEAKRRGLKI